MERAGSFRIKENESNESGGEAERKGEKRGVTKSDYGKERAGGEGVNVG